MSLISFAHAERGESRLPISQTRKQRPELLTTPQAMATLGPHTPGGPGVPPVGHTRPPRQPAALTHVGGDDDEGSQVGSAHVACHVAEVGLEAPEQPGRAPLAPLDVLPRGPGARGQQCAAHADDVLADRQTDGVRLAGAPACRGPANAGRGASGRGPPAFPAQRQAAVCPEGACWGSHVHPETQRGDALVTGDQPHQAHRVWELSGQPGS